MDALAAPVIGVVGSTGGVGASTFAAGLAAAAGTGLLVDLDRWGGGIDLLLGIDGVTGVRWSGLKVAGGSLDPVDLARGLPRWRGVSVLAADGARPTPSAVAAVLMAGSLLGPVIVDLGRCLDTHSDVVARCALIVIVAEAECRGLAAARVSSARLGQPQDPRPSVPPSAGLVVRRGSIGQVEAAALTGLDVVGELGPLTRRRDGARLPRSVLRVAAGVLEGVLGE